MVLFWKYSTRAFQWKPTWQGLDGFQKSLHPCVWANEASAFGGLAGVSKCLRPGAQYSLWWWLYEISIHVLTRWHCCNGSNGRDSFTKWGSLAFKYNLYQRLFEWNIWWAPLVMIFQNFPKVYPCLKFFACFMFWSLCRMPVQQSDSWTPLFKYWTQVKHLGYDDILCTRLYASYII